jgi:hypothetical protein
MQRFNKWGVIITVKIKNPNPLDMENIWVGVKYE